MELMDLGLSPLTAHALFRAGIKDLNKLRKRMAEDAEGVRTIKGMGAARWREVCGFLEKLKEFFKCGECSKVLSRLPWNTKGDILICNDWRCRRYHSVQGWVSSPRFDMGDLINDNFRIQTIAPWIDEGDTFERAKIVMRR